MSQPVALTQADYARAERFLPWNVAPMVYHAGVEPHWIAEGPRFWYHVRTRAGRRFMLVDPEANEQRVAVDHGQLADALARATGAPHDPDALPLEDIEFAADLGSIAFDLGSKRWRCNLATWDCARVHTPRAIRGELLSPDGRWSAFVRDYNLWIRCLESGDERALTHDGVHDHDYAGPTDVVGTELSYRRAEQHEVQALWSPDSRRLVTHRLDQRAVARMPLVQSTPHDGSRRPVLHTYRYALPGDADVPLATLVICDVERGECTPVSGEPLLAPCLTPWEDRLVWWDHAGITLYFVREERGYGAAHLWVADAETGAARELLTERASTWVDIGPVQFSAEPPVHALADGELLWWSQRDGWGHLYLLDGATGAVIRQVTGGAWQVRAILHVDEATRTLWFSATGAETGRNPYLRHLYRISLDGGTPELLTPEDADHDVSFTPCGHWFVDTYSRLDLPPVSVLRTADGALVRVLETADIDDLLATGWRQPEPFQALARDGNTAIYGALFFPSNFDQHQRYPVIDDVYPGPHNTRTPVRFPLPNTAPGSWQAQALAELGCIVVMLDGLGTGYRSKAFQDAAWGPGFGEAGGLPDHVHALTHLAQERPYLDLTRVGVCGHSGGGFAAVRALLLFPEFYSVGVAASGNHDQRGYHPQWGERYLGADIAHHYAEAANSSLAERLTGKLLLVHGELDDDVHPALTLQLVDALVQANRDFDLLIVPNANHAYHDPTLPGDHARGSAVAERYVLRRRWDYFVIHLLGATPPANYLIRAPVDDAAKGGSA